MIIFWHSGELLAVTLRLDTCGREVPNLKGSCQWHTRKGMNYWTRSSISINPLLILQIVVCGISHRRGSISWRIYTRKKYPVLRQQDSSGSSRQSVRFFMTHKLSWRTNGGHRGLRTRLLNNHAIEMKVTLSFPQCWTRKKNWSNELSIHSPHSSKKKHVMCNCESRTGLKKNH